MIKQFLSLSVCLSTLLLAGHLWASSPNYSAARNLGAYVADQAATALEAEWTPGECIVVTNAGYARPMGHSSLGCVDGVTAGCGASLGRGTLITLQSRFDQALWFAFYDRASGRCTYYQLSTKKTGQALKGQKAIHSDLFSHTDTARIDAQTILAHPQSFENKAKQGLFADNLFRVVTVANAADQGCPDYVLQALQVHDHYCPGVSSGILMATYIQKELISSPETSCFVLSLNPWCKEDALTTLLNATPGKRAYGVLYPSKGQIKSWSGPLNRVDTVAFLKGPDDEHWKGYCLGFDFEQARGKQDLPAYDFIVLNKLASDLWFLDRLDQPEAFVSMLETLHLPSGMEPKDLLRPGKNPVQILEKMM